MIIHDAPVLSVDEIDSTSAEARRRAEAGEFGPLWIQARGQTAGRGRRGRAWTTIPGNLFCTYLGAAQASPAQAALLGFAAAVAVAESIAAAAPSASTRLKWPNDVLLNGGKAAGLLLESGVRGPGALWFSLGIGVNVAGHPDDAGYPAASLASAGSDVTADALFADLRARLSVWSQRLDAEGFAPVRAAWLAKGPAFGAAIVVSDGAQRFEGRFEDLAQTGLLVVRMASGAVREFSTGDVSPPYPQAG